MQYVLTPHSRRYETYIWRTEVFTEDQLNWLQHKAKNADQEAVIASGLNKDIRRANIEWLFNTKENNWVFQALAGVVADVNAHHFGFDLTGFGEGLQLTHYDQSEHGMYGWHQDYNSNVSRKLTVVVQLTDPAEYEGGNLQIAVDAEPITVRKQRGLVAIFPAFTLHQVTPVVNGSRQTLVAWVSGPAFR